MGFLKRVNNGKLGINQGLPNGLNTMNKYIYGIQKARYYLIGGESGSGKTTLVDSMFLFQPYRYLQSCKTEGIKKSITWTYFSFEQSKSSKEDSWCSKVIFDKYGVRLPAAYLLSKGKNRVSDEDYKLCVTANNDIEEMLHFVEMVDVALGPSQIKAYFMRYGDKHGRWLKDPWLDEYGNHKKDKNGKSLYILSGWLPNDPNQEHIFMIDHIAYAQQEYTSLKTNIDAISRMIVFFRELTKWIFAVVQQFNTELSSIERQKYKQNALSPQRNDFGDSKYTYQDADVVLGVLNPYKFDLDNYRDYSIGKLEGYALWIFLMKNRHEGPAERAIPYFMDPVAGTFEELPEPISQAVIASKIIADPLARFYDKAREITEQINLYH